MTINKIYRHRMERVLTSLNSERLRHGKMVFSCKDGDISKSHKDVADDFMLASLIVREVSHSAENISEEQGSVFSAEALDLRFGDAIEIEGDKFNPYLVTEAGLTDCIGRISNYMLDALIDERFDWKILFSLAHNEMPWQIHREVWCTGVVSTKTPVNCTVHSYYVTCEDSIMVRLTTKVGDVNWYKDFLVSDGNGSSDIGKSIFESSEAAWKAKAHADEALQSIGKAKAQRSPKF